MIWKALFGSGDRARPSRLAEVRNITIGRTVTLDPLAWRMLENSGFQLDRDTLEITAQGIVRLDDGSHVHRFYTDDELMLQAVSQQADGSDADDFTLFRPWSSDYPADRGDKEAFLRRLARPRWEQDGLPPFRRYWYEDDDREQPPVQLWEAVYYDRDAEPVRHIRQTCMLYARDLRPAGLELLLALAMEPEGGDYTHEIMVGLPLGPAEFGA
ncbi:DUF2491 family protein [Sphingomonas rubra]|uniref:DUF2491 domain-containing protein n=1 Tax=Sphingomonas rubra TaxID=634430 RepID=A0A1I5QYN8_9SPHN|nr:DUF2491 family protein [Sphingomonas rubra]SFP51379.1 Protein of unknown function [Sphingomonas rubra]